VDPRLGTPGPAPGLLHGLETFNLLIVVRGSRDPRHRSSITLVIDYRTCELLGRQQAGSSVTWATVPALPRHVVHRQPID
jgi:hypothetical protein